MQTIILLEDDDDIRELVEIILEGEHFRVVSFRNVAEFSARDPDLNADLFLLDVRLPDGSGIDVCEELMSVNDTPVIIMSAHATLELINKSCDPSDFIEKPFDIDSLVSRIKAQIHR
ncbi:response regulator transcription factor [Pedobacter aquatilis]|uniref:response regulator transcription factor n=1 Tax=Pedobacter aquatilis TaxID=351343 RepID=UPI00292EA7E3|nr:response regulator [Pedobacter aquatilis]